MNKIIHPVEPEELMAYLDGELTANRASATAAHLRECVECQGLVAEFGKVSANLRTWRVELPESALPQAIATALSERTQGSQKGGGSKSLAWREILSLRRETFAWVGAMAAILLIVVGTVTFIGRNANSVFSQVGPLAIGNQLSRPRAEVSLAPPPPARRGNLPDGGTDDKLEMFAKLQEAPPVQSAGSNPDQSAEEHRLVATGPMIIRTAQLSLITKEFDKARANLEAILKRHRGYVGELKAGGNAGSGRTLTATLRVPADQLDATLNDVKTLGRVESESQSGQDVTSQYVDLQARLTNARNTEQRLTDLLRNRTGKLSDVLAVEQEVDRVRGEIEQMEAERKNMSNQVSFATLNATITEDYQAQLQVVPPSTSTRLSNAAVEGYRSMVDGVVGLALFLLSNGPTLLLWGAVLFLPARMVWKKVRRSFAS
jgi:Domain of unknown function (DUF4349)/Putative zinc-finger